MRTYGKKSTLATVTRFGVAAGVMLTPFLLAAAVGSAGSAVLLAMAPPALAIDAGQAKGVLRVGDERIELSHAHAHFHDNAEGILDRPKELRIVVADSAVSVGELSGTKFLPIEERAKQGGIKGVLIVLDPADPNKLNVTYLYPPEGGFSLMNQTLSTGGKDLWTRFDFDPQRVIGVLAEGDLEGPDDPGARFPMRAFSVDFSAPVLNEAPVTADLKGKEAKQSPQAEALRQRTQAMLAGNIDGIESYSSARSNAQLQGFISASGMSREEFAEMIKQDAQTEMELLEYIDRVVVRGDRALVIYALDEGSRWASVVLENGSWKSD